MGKVQGPITGEGSRRFLGHPSPCNQVDSSTDPHVTLENLTSTPIAGPSTCQDGHPNAVNEMMEFNKQENHPIFMCKWASLNAVKRVSLWEEISDSEAEEETMGVDDIAKAIPPNDHETNETIVFGY
ncbi:hypothetical protein EDD18DRAFT_1118486 [Armillaria luteobubalina]|uniref:Uncharacterized protein n=1 Tax=Armillaria luteobubalina TaxID=153913 RepID=A0AA39U7K2_9AGAR|nr:hypothetical protein EDD18DRAFT_1118486 [Armillaria luteobubalina]